MFYFVNGFRAIGPAWPVCIPQRSTSFEGGVSSHRQVVVIKQTPVFTHERSFVPAHFSLETMMVGTHASL
jgi:hypothetical protein